LSDLLDRLRDLYGESDDAAASALRLTDHGIWHPTPLAVVAAAVSFLGETGFLKAQGRPLRALDAGAGDGRLVAALALGLPATIDARVAGIESDAHLAATARARLELAAPRLFREGLVQIAEGDFFDLRSYAALGWAPRDVDLVFNYPDGNEKRLAGWLAEHGGPQTRLAVLSPDHDPALGLAADWRAPVRSNGDASTEWTLAVFTPAKTARW
jgi:SAM-dependent methyltransferase